MGSWLSYGAREYDPSIGRWMAIDPKAEKYYEWSGYNYVLGNPVRNIDPMGDTVFVNTIGEITRNDETDNLVYMTDGDNTSFIGEVGGDIDLTEIYANMVAENVKEAKENSSWKLMKSARAFKRRVQNGGKWDYNNRKDHIIGLANHSSGEQTQFDIGIRESVEAQDIGNHHFGIVGKATSLFPEKTMLREAGEAQIAVGTSKPEWQNHTMIVSNTGQVHRVPRPPYGDDPRDQRMIKAGFKYYRNFKRNKKK